MNSDHWQENKASDEAEGVVIKSSEFLERYKEVPGTVQPSSRTPEVLVVSLLSPPRGQSREGSLKVNRSDCEGSEAWSDSDQSCLAFDRTALTEALPAYVKRPEYLVAPNVYRQDRMSAERVSQLTT